MAGLDSVYRESQINDVGLEELLASYDESAYPEVFLEKYFLTECLAERNGTDTFAAVDASGSKYIAKCYDRSLWDMEEGSILRNLQGAGLPRFVESFSNERMLVNVREYIEGVSLDVYAAENDLSRENITEICMKLCDILSGLHHRTEPVIHRDIKPQNVIISSDDDGTILNVTLIDFDIARKYKSGSDTDTRFFGTQAYAAPEQYGFSQTDARADIYSFGVLLRYLLTGSTRKNDKITVYKPLAAVIDKCTAFSPDDRYSDIDQVKKALSQANPQAQKRRALKLTACCVLALMLVSFAGFRIYKAVTWTPFNDDAIPAFTSDEERVSDAVSYMNEKYDTDLFGGTQQTLDGTEGADSVATIGLLKTVLIDVYGLDADYVNAPNTDIPNESEDFFFPWTWADDQTIGRGTMVYVAVKVHDPAIVADWSSLKDDNGEYPGERVALEFAEETGIMTGANRPDDITVGEMALILANAERVFDAAAEAEAKRVVN